MPVQKPDRDTQHGIGRGLKTAFAPNSPIDPELQRLIRVSEGVYIPDEVSDQRVSQLLQRLKDLPWGYPPIIIKDENQP
jgi:hypothetical protein